MKSSEKENIIRSIQSFYPSVLAVYLFGSQAKNETNSTSDIDLAILLPPGTDKLAGNLCGSTLALELEDKLATKIDLVNISLVDTVFQNEILNTAERIYLSELLTVENFELRVIAMYQKLTRERTEIIKRGIESGSFYQS